MKCINSFGIFLTVSQASDTGRIYVLTQFGLVCVTLVGLVLTEIHSVFVLEPEREVTYLVRGFWS